MTFKLRTPDLLKKDCMEIDVKNLLDYNVLFKYTKSNNKKSLRVKYYVYGCKKDEKGKNYDIYYSEGHKKCSPIRDKLRNNCKSHCLYFHIFHIMFFFFVVALKFFSCN